MFVIPKLELCLLQNNGGWTIDGRTKDVVPNLKSGLYQSYFPDGIIVFRCPDFHFVKLPCGESE